MKSLAARLTAFSTTTAVRLLLLAYPARFRNRFTDELLQSVRRDLEEAAQAGTLALVAAAGRAMGDAATGIVPEHRTQRAQVRRGTAPHTGGFAMVQHGLLDDIRQAARALRQTPTFTVVAIGVLGLAIGAATAIFSIVDAIVLRGLPFHQANRIVSVQEYVPDSRYSGGSSTPQTYLDWKAEQRSFEQFAAANRATFRSRNERGEPVHVRAMRITSDFLPLLRVQPLVGRSFTSADEVSGGDRVAILSYGFWQRQFGGSTDSLGRTLELNEQPWEVVGVMPRDFSYPVGSAFQAEIFTPAAFHPDERVRSRGRNFVYSVVGRLKPGVSIAQATDDMNRIAAAIDAENPTWNPGSRVRILTLHEALVGRVRSWMLMLFGAVALVLLIACANVANLMLVRSTVRSREMGIRAALGASRWRIARGLLVEGVLLSALAASLGVALAWFGVQVLTAWLPGGVPRVTSVALDLRVLAAAAGAAVFIGVVFSLAPAVQSSRADLTVAFKAGGRTSTGGGRGKRLRNIFVVVEVALAVVLLVGAGLFMSSFVGLMRIDPGFDYRNVLTLSINLRFERGDDLEDRLRRGTPYVQQMLDAVSRVPGVVEAGAVSGGLPLTGNWQTNPVSFPGRPALQGDEREINTRWVSPGYLSILRIPLARGRYLRADDRAGAPPVVLVNEAAARHYWLDRDALGGRIVIEGREMTVVGIVGNIRHGGPESPANPEAYVPLAQDRVLSAALVMRTAGDPLAVLPAVKAAIWSVNPEQRLTTDTVTLDGYMDRLIAQRRFNMALLVLFGVLGLVIAAAGIYGVMAYVVAQRTGEIGVRMALGATPRNIVAMILTNAGVLMAIGLTMGFMCARYLSATVEAFLFQVEPTDARVFVGAIATLALAGLVASALPARRAASVDPVVALRTE